MGLTKKLISFLLLALFAFHFASTKLYIHTHQLSYGKIVHSHPFSSKSHTHSSLQFDVISSLNSSVLDECDAVHVNFEIQNYFISESYSYNTPFVNFNIPHAFGLKAPPTFLS